MSDGMFGPGIFGTGIDLSALDEDTALRLGQFSGEQLAAAEARGYQRAIDALRDDTGYASWHRVQVEPRTLLGAVHRDVAADYLASLAPKEPDHA